MRIPSAEICMRTGNWSWQDVYVINFVLKNTLISHAFLVSNKSSFSLLSIHRIGYNAILCKTISSTLRSSFEKNKFDDFFFFFLQYFAQYNALNIKRYENFVMIKLNYILE